MHRQTTYLSSAQTDTAEPQQNSNMAVALAVAVVAFLCSGMAHTHVLCSCTYSAHAQIDKLFVICTDRHGCTAAEQQHVGCPSSSAAALLLTLCFAHARALCFALSHVTFGDLGWINREIWGCLKLVFITLPDGVIFSWPFCSFVSFLCFSSH